MSVDFVTSNVSKTKIRGGGEQNIRSHSTHLHAPFRTHLIQYFGSSVCRLIVISIIWTWCILLKRLISIAIYHINNPFIPAALLSKIVLGNCKNVRSRFETRRGCQQKCRKNVDGGGRGGLESKTSKKRDIIYERTLTSTKVTTKLNPFKT